MFQPLHLNSIKENINPLTILKIIEQKSRKNTLERAIKNAFQLMTKIIKYLNLKNYNKLPKLK